MVGVVIIAVVFTGIAGGLFYGSSRGGLNKITDAMLTQSRGGRRVINSMLVFTYVAFGVVLPAVMLIGNHDQASAQVAGIKLTSGEKMGRELFGEHCAVCHTLAAASAIGKVGPNLDMLKPPRTLVLNTLQYGCLQDPGAANSAQNCLGYGNMPADIVEGREAQEVASFVSKVAGHA